MSDGSVRLLDPPDNREELVRGLVAQDLVPTTVVEEGQSLEEYFLSVVDHTAQPADVSEKKENDRV